jgi:peptidoglycan hydrolase-like protein with peptidoglycan-binding domain
VSAFTFTKDLKVGMKSEDVKELQKYLISQGYFTGDTTGYFGKLTKIAVIKFQKAHGLPATGMFGKLSRAVTNSN